MATPSTKRLPRNFFDDAVPFKCDGVYCKLIPLTQGQFALVWLSDYLILSRSRWCSRWDRKMRSFYAIRRIKLSYRKTTVISMQREILGLKYGDKRQGDHAFGCTLDNRRFIGEKPNLRISSRSQNLCNQRCQKNNTTKFKGVSEDKGMYRARITKDGKCQYLGARKTATAAYEELYVPAALKLHGEFARVA